MSSSEGVGRTFDILADARLHAWMSSGKAGCICPPRDSRAGRKTIERLDTVVVIEQGPLHA